MTRRMSLDRFEGESKQIAVLVSEDGVELTLPKALLPDGAKAGDLLNWSLEVDAEATEATRERTRAIMENLRKTDPGGDVKL